jgi:GNAT superfamily N-acetyltransferase
MSDPIILVRDEISDRERQAIIAPLGKFSAARGFVFRPQPIIVLLRDGDAIAGGLLGDTNWDWLHIEILAVTADLCGRGYGRQLMEQAEALARERGCVGACVDIFSSQSPGFYQPRLSNIWDAAKLSRSRAAHISDEDAGAMIQPDPAMQ